MYILRTIISWGWAPILITALAVLGYIYQWRIQVIVPVLIVILLIGLVIASISAREKGLERTSIRLKELSGYFTRRFTGASSLSIFAIIASLFNTDNPTAWEWARACDMSQRIFNTWCDGFISRAETDLRTRMFNIYLRNYLNELWLINTHYYDFIEQFYEIAEKVEIPQETIEQYNRFVMEYNAFAENFRDNITELRKTHKTEIEPPSVKLARELRKVDLNVKMPDTPPTPQEG